MSLDTLTQCHEITVFKVLDSQDDMAGHVETQNPIRRKVKCRMVPMSREQKIAHDIPIMEESYLAYFGVDPELTSDFMAIYDKKVYTVESAMNASRQGWVWEVAFRHQPGMEIAV